MISEKSVVLLKINNHPNLAKIKHPLVTTKVAKKGRKTFLLGSSNLMNIKMNFGFGSYVSVPDRTCDPLSPFDKPTYIQCVTAYYIDGVKITTDALTNPSCLPDKYFNQIMFKAKGIGKTMINTSEAIRLNPNICLPV